MGISTTDLNTIGPHRVLVAGRVATDGSGDPGTITGKGIASVSKEATGHYRFTLDRVYPAIESVHPSIEIDDLTTDVVIKVKTFDASAKTVDVAIYNVGGTMADLVSGAINVLVFCKNTGLD